MNVRQIREPSAGRGAFPSPTLPPGPGWKAGQELVGVAASFGIKAQCIGQIFKDVRKIELSRNPNHYDGGSSNSHPGHQTAIIEYCDAHIRPHDGRLE
jgi:hypothetical protein